MFYSLNTIVKSLPKKKNSKSSLWVKTIVRPLSFLFTFVFINLRFSAWAVSVLSVAVALGGCTLLCIDSFACRVIGVILVEFWLILDCVDGNIARVKKTSSPMGSFIDALSGYYITAFVFLAIGVSASYTTSVFNDYSSLFVILGGISAIAGILSRTIHQKYAYTVLVLNEQKEEKETTPEEETENKRSIQYIRSRVDKELNISGLFMPFLIVSLIFDLYDFMTLFYLAFQALGLIAVTAYYALKAR